MPWLNASAVFDCGCAPGTVNLLGCPMACPCWLGSTPADGLNRHRTQAAALAGLTCVQLTQIQGMRSFWFKIACLNAISNFVLWACALAARSFSQISQRVALSGLRY